MSTIRRVSRDDLSALRIRQGNRKGAILEDWINRMTVVLGEHEVRSTVSCTRVAVISTGRTLCSPVQLEGMKDSSRVARVTLLDGMLGSELYSPSSCKARL